MAWSDSTIRLINTDSSRIIHQIELGPGSLKSDSWGRLSQHQDTTCLGWGLNFTDSVDVRARIDASGATLDDFLSHASLASTHESFSDLPKELTVLDIEPTLPKLSILPSAGKE